MSTFSLHSFRGCTLQADVGPLGIIVSTDSTGVMTEREGFGYGSGEAQNDRTSNARPGK